MLTDILRWWLVVEALGLLALPLTIWFFRGLPDRGYSFAKSLGILLTGYGAWLLSMLGLGALGPLQLGLTAALVGLGGLVLTGRNWRHQGAELLRQQAGWIAFQEVLFAAALGLGIWLRWHQFWGFGAGIQTTEQPMDLTLLSGILASSQFPPQDPWFAPYPINYYYLGYLLIASVIRLAGVSAGVGYTLGLALIFALTAVSVAGIVRNLIELTEEREQIADSRQQLADSRDIAAERPEETAQHPEQGAAVRRRPQSAGLKLGRWVFPLLGAVFVLICANQAGALAVLAGSEKVVALEPVELAQALSNGLGAREPIELPPSFPAGDFGGETRLDPNRPLIDASFAWWPSRALWDTRVAPDGSTQRVYNITEFPFFSFLLGDLHPHVQSLPWALLAVGLGLNILTGRRAPDFRSRADLARLVVTGIVLGGLYAINSWDLPTYLLLYLGALALLYLKLASSPRNFFWPHFIQQAGAVILVSYLVYIPFHLTFVAPTEGFPLAISPARTGLVEFIVIFGLFFVPLLAYVAHTAGEVAQRDDAVSRQARFSGALLLGGFTAMLLVGVMIGWPLAGLLFLALWASYQAFEQREQPAHAFALWLFALGALVMWGVDVVYLRDIYGTRMNTIFKFFYQVWLLWGTLAAYALWTLSRKIRWSTAVWLVPVVVLFAGSLVYPLRAPADDALNRTIDGLAYLRNDVPDEAAAIDWIRTNTPTNAVVLQAPGKAYNAGTARIASVTGRPTVIGWTQHERLWRGGQPGLVEEVEQREQDVQLIYTSPDPALAQSLLARYDVDYVVVGPNEQALVSEANAPAEALTKFDSWLQPVFRQGSYTIYGQP